MNIKKITFILILLFSTEILLSQNVVSIFSEIDSISVNVETNKVDSVINFKLEELKKTYFDLLSEQEPESILETYDGIIKVYRKLFLSVYVNITTFDSEESNSTIGAYLYDNSGSLKFYIDLDSTSINLGNGKWRIYCMNFGDSTFELSAIFEVKDNHFEGRFEKYQEEKLIESRKYQNGVVVDSLFRYSDGQIHFLAIYSKTGELLLSTLYYNYIKKSINLFEDHRLNLAFTFNEDNTFQSLYIPDDNCYGVILNYYTVDKSGKLIPHGYGNPQVTCQVSPINFELKINHKNRLKRINFFDDQNKTITKYYKFDKYGMIIYE